AGCRLFLCFTLIFGFSTRIVLIYAQNVVYFVFYTQICYFFVHSGDNLDERLLNSFWHSSLHPSLPIMVIPMTISKTRKHTVHTTSSGNLDTQYKALPLCSKTFQTQL